MAAGLLYSAVQMISQWRPCLELSQALKHFELTFIEAQLASMMIGNVRSLKLQIKTCSFLEQIITYCNEILIDSESNMAVGIRKMGNLTHETAKNYVIVQQNAGS